MLYLPSFPVENSKEVDTQQYCIPARRGTQEKAVSSYSTACTPSLTAAFAHYGIVTRIPDRVLPNPLRRRVTPPPLDQPWAEALIGGPMEHAAPNIVPGAHTWWWWDGVRAEVGSAK